MKNFIWVTLLLISFPAVHAEKLEIKSKNLTLYALKKQPTLDLAQLAGHVLEEEFSPEYIKSRKDPDALKALTEKKVAEIKNEIAKIPQSPVFGMQGNTIFYNFTEESEELRLRPFQVNSYLQIPTKEWFAEKKFPYIRLNFANLEILNKVNVKAVDFDKLLQMKSQSINPKELYWELELELPEFQNHFEFQVVIRSARLYESSKKELMLAEVKESRSNQNIIKSRLLSEGVSLDFIGIHGFDLSGFRLQELMNETPKMREICKKTKRIKNHQVIVCRRPFLGKVDLIESYIGGITVQLDLVLTKPLTQEDKRELSKIIMMEFKQNKSMFEKEHLSWNKYGIKFELFTDAFFDQQTEKSKYSSIYDDSLNSQQLTKVAQLRSEKVMEMLK